MGIAGSSDMDIVGRSDVRLTRRSYAPADAPAVAALLNAVEERAGGHPTATPAELTAMVGALVRDPAEQTRLVFSPDRLVAAALNIAPPPGGFRFDAMGGVHPDWCGLGIGRDLLDWQLRQARAAHRASNMDEPWQIRFKTVADAPAAIRLYERFGLKPVRYWYSMTTAIGSPDPWPLPGGLRVGEYTTAYEADLHALHMEAFDDHWRYQARDRDEWTAITVRAPTFLPNLSLLASDAGGLAGYVLSYVGAEPGRLFLGQCGVRRDWRRRGLAGTLVSWVLARARTEGRYTTAGLITDAANPSGAVTVGLRNGFAIETRGVTYAADIA